MQIFTRKGQLLFKTNDIDIGWDGTFENELASGGFMRI